MKWFKHKTDASGDEFIVELVELFGLEGYARWFLVLETIAIGMDESDKCSITLSWVEWQKILCGKRVKLESFLIHCENKLKLKLERNGNLLKITCPKLLEMRDEYTRKKKKTPDTSAQDIRDKSKEKKEVKEKSSAQAPVNDKNQMKGAFSALPPWMPVQEWQDFKEMRLKIRKPMTAKAEDLIISKLRAFKDRRLDIRAILNQSIENAWAGVFEIKPELRGKMQKDEVPYHERMENYKT